MTAGSTNFTRFLVERDFYQGLLFRDTVYAGARLSLFIAVHTTYQRVSFTYLLTYFQHETKAKKSHRQWVI